jgi:transcriptional regulator with XRE-family HTH domain
MGGPGSGKRGGEGQQRRAAELRAAGWNGAEIARALGVSRQAVHLMLGRSRKAPARPVLCKACRAELAAAGGPAERGALCLPCLARRRAASFGLRLKSCRVAAGLTRLRLAERSGVPVGLIGKYEHESPAPRLSYVERIARALGPRLVPPLLGVAEGPATETAGAEV